MMAKTLVLLGVVVALVIFRGIIWSRLRTLLVNTVIGAVAVISAATLLNLSVALTPVSILLIVLGGLPGSLLTLALAKFGIAFTGSGVSPRTWAIIGQVVDNLAGVI